MKGAVYFVALILGCYGQGFRGYYYPRPSCPLQLPVTYTVTATQTQVYSSEATVYQTQYLTNVVTVPVLLTSTVITERLLTSYATVISTVPQYVTETNTIYITPSPVVRFSTIVSTATVCSDVSSDSQKAVSNAYLPPEGNSHGSQAAVDDFKQAVDNSYLPPSGGDDSGNVINLSVGSFGGDSLKRSTASFTSFNNKRARNLLHLGALPPSV
ncbi:uncharacterized protein LOC131437678 [Malaya genurostris]|uniref:uncharacterized protein LOC131437678 n=1 Tax=Malaya genurostris TaxID=325434 RepID=UPI0026F3E89C|nr:uncharacterized protein LOC131437678 [Malaya genurostris]